MPSVPVEVWEEVMKFAGVDTYIEYGVFTKSLDSYFTRVHNLGGNFMRHTSPVTFQYLVEKNDYNVLKEFLEYNRQPILDCLYKMLDSVPYIECLNELNCGYNEISYIPPMPNLKVLKCKHNRLTSLSEYPVLRVLECNNNSIKEIRNFPLLEYLYCWQNGLEKLPDVMENAGVVLCMNNALTSLPVMPVVYELDCGFNDRLESFPIYDTLITLGTTVGPHVYVPYCPKLLVFNHSNVFTWSDGEYRTTL